ncbi:MAG: hypothetical protein P1P76_00745 [Anaerolineales bacterium]|nr:hypothetical protein [Anaerolineales bacterium]
MGEQDLVRRVSREVVGKFPEMAGVRPTVKHQKDNTGDVAQILLTYKGKAVLPGGKTIKRIVRVVANERGQIKKISTSK